MISENIVMNLLAAGFGALLLAAFLVPLVKLLALRLGAVDEPNARKVHAKRMPRMGGLAIYFAFWIMVFLAAPTPKYLLATFIGGTLLIVVGIVDDISDMPAKLKLLGQVIAACIAAFGGVRIQFLSGLFGPELWHLSVLAIPVTVVWIVAIVNAVNLIDGLDGLAAGVSAIAAASMAVVGFQNGDAISTVLGVTLAGAALGFLVHNFHPASIFMGDTGSMFLGYMLAIISAHGALKSVTFVSVFIPILILGVPIFDTLFAIFRRALSGQPLFEADKAHLHHCLLRYGFSHRNTVLFIYSVSIALSVCALVVSRVTTGQGFLIFIGALTVLLVGANRLGIIGSKTKEEKEHKK